MLPLDDTIAALASPPGAGERGIVRVSGPDNLVLERSYALAVRPATQILARRTVKPLARGESLTLSNELFSDLVPGTGSVAVSVGVSSALDAAALLAALDRYPFGCSEQIASRALPLLYVNDLAHAAQLALDTAVDQRIRVGHEFCLIELRATAEGVPAVPPHGWQRPGAAPLSGATLVDRGRVPAGG